MKNRVRIHTLGDHVDKEVTIAGWVHVRRDHGKLIFLDIRDRTGVVQTVSLPDNSDVHKTSETLRPEWVVSVKGIVNKRPEKMVNPELPMGDVEVEAKELTVLSKAGELPFDLDSQINIDTELDYRPLTLRNERRRAIFTVQARITELFRTFLHNEGFTEIQAPNIVGEDAEGGAAAFEISYFDNKAFLATSPQLYKQIMVGVYERVFATINIHRAEKHSTTARASDVSG